VSAVTVPLHHYSPERFELARDFRYQRPTLDHKPAGLWVTVPGEDDWPSWCEAESFGLGRLEHEYQVTLSEGANILILSSPSDIAQFDREYGAALHPQVESYRGIHWEAVEARYDGILIAPYQWSCRRDFSWYSGWDVASGCIWNLAVVASVSLVETHERVSS